jgi:flagellar hook-associated protein 3 FlgL
LRVGQSTETFTINSNVTDNITLAAELNTPANAARLANLGISIGGAPPGFIAASGLNVEVDPNTTSGPNILAALGLTNASASTNGVRAVKGDSAFVESSNSQGLLVTLQRFSEALRQVRDGDPSSKELVGNVVASTLTGIDKSELSINEVLSEIGARMNTLESTRDLHLDSDLLNNEVLRDLEALDYTEAATRLSLQEFILQATQQSFIRVSGLTLFSLL